MLPRNFQSRYRRHLFNCKVHFQIILASWSLHQLSRLCIHLAQEFHIRPIQSRNDTCLKQISSFLFTTKSHNKKKNLSHQQPSSSSRSRRHHSFSSSRRRHDAHLILRRDVWCNGAKIQRERQAHTPNLGSNPNFWPHTHTRDKKEARDARFESTRENNTRTHILPFCPDHRRKDLGRERVRVRERRFCVLFCRGCFTARKHQGRRREEEEEEEEDDCEIWGRSCGERIITLLCSEARAIWY